MLFLTKWGKKEKFLCKAHEERWGCLTRPDETNESLANNYIVFDENEKSPSDAQSCDRSVPLKRSVFIM